MLVSTLSEAEIYEIDLEFWAVVTPETVGFLNNWMFKEYLVAYQKIVEIQNYLKMCKSTSYERVWEFYSSWSNSEFQNEINLNFGF